MCDTSTKRPPASVSAAQLATLMERELGISRIDSIALRLFIKCHWSKITKLAHEIHDGD